MINNIYNFIKTKLKIKNNFIIIEKLISKNLKRYFINLNVSEFNIINKIIVLIIYYISIKFNIANINEFITQLTMNNNKNLYSIFNIIYPYLNDTNGYYNQKNIQSIHDLITNKKYSDNHTVNSYKYSNYIYDHNKTEITSHTNDDFETLKITIKDYDDISDLYYINLYYFLIKTIDKSSYKLYVNWINIFPLTLETYKESNLYKVSYKYNELKKKFYYNDIEINWHRIILNLENETVDIDLKYTQLYENNFNMFQYSGITVEDIYNTLVQDYYNDIKSIRWLIFEVNNNNKITLMIEIVDEIFSINNMLSELSWEELSLSEQNKIKIECNKLLESIENNQKFQNYENENIKKLFLYIYYSFIRFFNNIKELIDDDIITDEEYQVIKSDIDSLDEDNEEIIKNKLNFENIYKIITDKDKFNNLFNFAKKIPIKEIYNFIQELVIKLKNSVYSLKLFNNNKLKDQLLEENNITPKNYYNFGKSLSYTNDKQYSLLWDGLDTNECFEICYRLNSIKPYWFNIPNIIKNIYKNDDKNFIKSKTEIIYEHIRKQIIELTFENLIRKGCLSEYKFNYEIAKDNQTIDELHYNFNNKIFTTENKKKYNEAFSFINNKKYKNFDHYRSEDNIIYTSYLDLIADIKKTKMHIWTHAYAFNWVGQIDFLLKFLNHSVLFITGATGQGKSTQTPKLILYSLKAFNYKNKAKVIITQPRISPTIGISRYISYQLGVPITNFNNKLEEYRTLNTQIQYKYSGDSHKNKFSNFFIRYVTDGTLLADLKKSITLKKSIQEKNGDKYLISNIYDCIIIDEAHEHNANMDIILTLMRNTLFLNNDIKLVIASATMDDDEPIFRKFYKYNNSNFIYPINSINCDYFTFNQKTLLDRNFIDRRWHISPPGVTTKFTITEFYDEYSLDEYKNNIEIGINIIKKILSTTDTGDLLFFLTTTNEIIKTAKMINEIIPYNVICLPYYAKLDKKYIKLIANIASKKNTITIDKKDIIDVFSGKITESQASKVSKGTYTRVILAATNVAEASITIESLRYVIDLGYEWNVSYNYDNNNTVLEAIKISEASRLQRKGRVGRSAPGTIYYTYPKNSRFHIKSKYDISIKDFSDTFSDLLDDNSKKNILNIEVLKSFYLLSNKSIESTNKDSLSYILNKQFKLNKYNTQKLGFHFKKYLNNLENIINWLFPIYEKGFDLKHIIDIGGHFYLIHPLEQQFRRDIMTNNFIDDDNTRIFLDVTDIDKLYQTAQKKLQIIKIGNKNEAIFKTTLHSILNDLKQKFSIVDNNQITLIISSLVMDDYISNKDIYFIKGAIINYKLIKTYLKVNFINILLNDISHDISKLINVKTRKNETYTTFFKTKNNISDFKYFNNLYNTIFNIFNFNDFILNFDNKFNQLNRVIDLINKNDLSAMDYTDIDTYNYLIKMKLNNKLNINLINSEIKKIAEKNDILIFLDKLNLKLISESMQINYNIILNSTIKFLLLILKNDEILKNENKLIEKYSKIIKLKIPKNNLDKIILSFLNANLNNICEYNNGQYKLLNTNNVYNINNYFNNKLSFIQNSTPLIFYLGKNDMFKTISIITNLNKFNLLENYPHLYNYIDNGENILKSNMHFITNHISYLKKEKIIRFPFQSTFIKDINSLNIYYRLLYQILNSNQKGGNITNFVKVNYKTLLKKRIINKLNNKLKKKVINDASHSGIIIFNENRIDAIYLIKKYDNFVKIKTAYEKNKSFYNELKNRYLSKNLLVL